MKKLMLKIRGQITNNPPYSGYGLKSYKNYIHLLYCYNYNLKLIVIKVKSILFSIFRNLDASIYYDLFKS